ncbi:Hypothetical predicted protein [Paramuricea clavata]|uniref:Uncharacterized protein n=1 Tax=Paramuricea clavata TaxID=317549 RepID=A0A6S7I597_PARCT|nr:Hypothetical predicted protein [Paramuricea clavata]
MEAIKDMPFPTDVQSLRRFLGMVTYLARCLPCVSDETKVLRKLTEKDAEQCWLIAHKESVVRIQRLISIAPVLAYCKETAEPGSYRKSDEEYGEKQREAKKYFDRQSRKLKTMKRLSAGDVIRMRCPGDSNVIGKVIEVIGFRSYLVEVNGRKYRRNRRHLRTTAEQLPLQTELSDADESLTDDESIDEPADVDAMGGQRDETWGR